MIEFFGTTLMHADKANASNTNLAELFGVSEARSNELVEALLRAEKDACQQPMPNYDGPKRLLQPRGFNMLQFLETIKVDAESSSELLFIGILVGRIYSDVEADSTKTIKLINKVIALTAKGSAKAERKIERILQRQHKKQ